MDSFGFARGQPSDGSLCRVPPSVLEGSALGAERLIAVEVDDTHVAKLGALMKVR